MAKFRHAHAIDEAMGAKAAAPVLAALRGKSLKTYRQAAEDVQSGKRPAFVRIPARPAEDEPRAPRPRRCKRPSARFTIHRRRPRLEDDDATE